MRNRYIVYSSEIEDSRIINEAKKECLNYYSFIDARSAIYGATGIAAQNRETVIVYVNGNNTSRSAFSGMTEAFYRKLPIILVTLGGKLDYSEELGDVINGHYCVENENDLEALFKNDISLPAHIEFNVAEEIIKKQKCVQIQNAFSEILTTSDYLYFGSNIITADVNYNCKVVFGGMANCYSGALANVLGASLAKRHRRYIAVVTEEEFLNDMNTLGNINVNDRLLYVVICEDDNHLIANYAKSLGFQVVVNNKNGISQEIVELVVRNNKKTVFILFGGKF